MAHHGWLCTWTFVAAATLAIGPGCDNGGDSTDADLDGDIGHDSGRDSGRDGSGDGGLDGDGDEPRFDADADRPQDGSTDSDPDESQDSGLDSDPDESQDSGLDADADRPQDGSPDADISGRSDPFPPMAQLPLASDFLAQPVATHYCAPDGDNRTGDGSQHNPWHDLLGASSGGTGDPAAPGSLIYFRGGDYSGYPYENFSYSANRLTVDGTAQNPIVITNYPGERAAWHHTAHWALTLDGDHQILIGSEVEGEPGIHIHGGMTVRADHCRVIGIELQGGSSNGGDTNPAMLSVPLNDGCLGLVVSHCWFHDAVHQPPQDRMVALRTFTTTEIIVEHNTFEDNTNVYQGGNVYFKDRTRDATVRYNRFINGRGGVSFVAQGDVHDGLDVHHNLFVGIDNPIYFINEAGDNIRIHDNVALNITGGFLFYLNGDNVPFEASGEYFDNVILGPGFEQGWAAGSRNLSNIPDLFDWNLWASEQDRNNPFGEGFPPEGYHDHCLTAADVVAYSSTEHTCTVGPDYPGIGAGRYGGNIGGFLWSD